MGTQRDLENQIIRGPNRDLSCIYTVQKSNKAMKGKIGDLLLMENLQIENSSVLINPPGIIMSHRKEREC